MHTYNRLSFFYSSHIYMLFKESCGKEEVIGKCVFHAVGFRKTRFMLCSLVNVGVKIFKWLFGTVWTLSGGTAREA